MKYVKPPISFSGQADLLLSRGLLTDSKQEITEKLEAVSLLAKNADIPVTSMSLADGREASTLWH